MLSSALKFYWEAKTLNSIHSPLFYNLVSNILDLNKRYYDDTKIELVRKRCLIDKTTIEYVDLGAGSAVSGNTSKNVSTTLSKIAKSATSNAIKCRLLRNLVLYFQPSGILELGTNLGIATAYIHAASPSVPLVTVEGIPQIHDKAQLVMNQLGYESVTCVQDSFSSFLSSGHSIIQQSNLIFLDGDHTKKSTLENFMILWEAKGGNNAKQDSRRFNRRILKVIIVDDIYWSSGMEEAWEAIKALPDCMTLDLYKLGIAIKVSEISEPRHIKCVPRLLKPLSMGFLG